MPAQAEREPAGDALARMRFCHRYAEAPGELDERLLGRRIADASARNNQRTLSASEQLDGRGDGGGRGRAAMNAPHPLAQKIRRHIERLALDILRQRDRHGARFGRVDQHAHGARQRREQLFRPHHPVEKTRQRAEGVVHGDIGLDGVLELLQHIAGPPMRKSIGRQQQHRDAVDGGGRGAGQHVRRSGPDRARARHGRQAVLGLGVADRGMHHRLLVLRLVERQVGAVFVDGLTHAGDVAVAPDCPKPADQPLAAAVELGELPLQEFHRRLRDRQALKLAHGSRSLIFAGR